MTSSEPLMLTFNAIQSHFTSFFTNLHDYSQPSTYDYLLIVPFSIFITIARITLEQHVFAPLGVLLCRWNAPSFAASDPKGYHTKMVRFREQMFKCTFHALVGIFALVTFSGEHWFSNCSYTMYTRTSLLQFSNLHKLYYLVQTAFHLHSLVYHYVERRNHVRDDDLVMQIHHFATIFLLLGSFQLSHLRIGTLVLYVHDMSDVFTALTKLANYTKFRDAILAVLLINLVLSWAYYRLYRFPKDVILVIVDEIGFANSGLFVHSLMCGLIVLFVLHWIWYYQIIQIPLAMVRGNKEYDPTEHWNEATKQREAEKKKRVKLSETTEGMREKKQE